MRGFVGGGNPKPPPVVQFRGDPTNPEFRVQGLGFRVWGLGFGTWRSWVLITPLASISPLRTYLGDLGLF